MTVLWRRTYTFWRFLIEIPLDEHEMRVRYHVNHGQEFDFYVPGRNQNMRLAAYSVRCHCRDAMCLTQHYYQSAMASALVSMLTIFAGRGSKVATIRYG